MSFERRKIQVGKVISDKMEKTVVVEVDRRRAHPLYGKSVRRRSRFKAHDHEELCQIGDVVRIIENRPLSKTKRWRVNEILHREEVAGIQPEEISVDDIAIRADKLSPSIKNDTAVDEAPRSLEAVTEEESAEEEIAEEESAEEAVTEEESAEEAVAGEESAEEEVESDSGQEKNKGTKGGRG